MPRLAPTALLALALAAPVLDAQPSAPPPQVFVSFPPALLVRVDGTAVLVPVPGHAAVQRVRNTRAAILYAGRPTTEPVSDRDLRSAFYAKVDGTWLTAEFLVGPWTQASLLPYLRGRLDAVHDTLVQRGDVEPLTARGRATAALPLRLYVSEAPAELVVFDGPPRYDAVGGTGFVRVVNADHDVLRGGAERAYFVRLATGWVTAPALDGPWAPAPTGWPPAAVESGLGRRAP